MLIKRELHPESPRRPGLNATLTHRALANARHAAGKIVDSERVGRVAHGQAAESIDEQILERGNTDAATDRAEPIHLARPCDGPRHCGRALQRTGIYVRVEADKE